MAAEEKKPLIFNDSNKDDLTDFPPDYDDSTRTSVTYYRGLNSSIKGDK